MHILQVSPRIPYPLHDGGAIGIYNITAGLLRAGHRVTMLAINTPKHHQPADVLAHLGPNFRLVTVDVDTTARPLKALWNLLFSRRPYNIARFINSDVIGVLVPLIQTESFDVIQYEGTYVAWYHEWLDSEDLTPERAVSILRAHNIEYVIWERLAQGEKNLAKRQYLNQLAARLRRFEKEYLWCFDGVAAITKEDIVRLRELGCPEPIALVPAAVEMASFQPDPSIKPQPRTIFMIGSLNWLPNLEGLEWLLREVWPALHAELPDLELHVAGVAPPAHLLVPRHDNVFIHGFVESAAAFMRQYELMLVPLLSGGGMRVKIIEGMALGKGILSTSIGAEGIEVRDGHDIIRRDGAAAWQQTLRDYYHDRLPVAAIGGTAAITAAAVYANDRVTERFEALYARVGAGRAVQAG
ncbi:glycosyltransferase family 4 protein [Hymenobacter psoromatis]|uniref:glycosyltransferase family 4 protein n=1 Tax=Hymenobacter psoromatis TaxID=1484116 RepID=UPI001CBAB0E8|nr:glycosyltransferase family 4 protein [Hymenobacter psoromatis]